MKVAVYLRVSTRDKQEISNQRNYLLDYAARNNHQVHDVYADIGQSGMKASRPEWDRLLADMQHGFFNGILIYKLDRIGRSIVNLHDLFKRFENAHIALLSATQNIDTSTPEGKMFRNILVVFAEYERELTHQRIYDGLDNAKKQGKTLGRPKGKKDKKPRRKVGYYTRWDREKSKKT